MFKNSNVYRWLMDRFAQDGLWVLGVVYAIWVFLLGMLIGSMWMASALLGK